MDNQGVFTPAQEARIREIFQEEASGAGQNTKSAAERTAALFKDEVFRWSDLMNVSPSMFAMITDCYFQRMALHQTRKGNQAPEQHESQSHTTAE